MSKSFSTFKWPEADIFHLPGSNAPLPPCPLDLGSYFEPIYELTLSPYFVVSVAFGYFILVHLANTAIRRKQVASAKAQGLKFDASDEKALKRLPAVPIKFATTKAFKVLVFLHNLLLCVYSVWTFIGMTLSIRITSETYYSVLANVLETKNTVVANPTDKSMYRDLFWNAVCDLNNGIFSPALTRGLTFYGYLFYLSKFYEIWDTIIILLKGRPSSLLQSYHHSGAMLLMWAGVRYTAPPIWIFVVFNSFIHLLMYAYYTLSTLKIRVPKPVKQSLTTMQITQFVVGGSLAVVHLFVHYFEYTTGDFQPCIRDLNQFFALYVNVGYLFPLTVLFTAFWIDSYAKRRKAKKD